MSDAFFMIARTIRFRSVSFGLFAALSATCAATRAGADDMPTIVQDFGLTEVRVVPEPHKHHGRIVEGRLPDGSFIEIDVDRHDQVQEIKGDHGHAFPLKAVEQVVPQAVRSADTYPAEAHLWRLELHDDHEVEMEGYDAQHRRFKAEFSRNGHLLDMKFD